MIHYATSTKQTQVMPYPDSSVSGKPWPRPTRSSIPRNVNGLGGRSTLIYTVPQQD
jgi:hypothetical protein